MSDFAEQVLAQASRHPLTGEFGKVKNPGPRTLIAVAVKLAAADAYDRLLIDRAAYDFLCDLGGSDA